MKWRTVLCTALFLCGTVLLSACAPRGRDARACGTARFQ